MILQAYIDDSGTKNDGPLMVLAAMIGPAEVWAKISDAWERELNFQAGGRIAYFKEDEAAHLNGEFRHWRAEARDAKVRRLSKIVNRTDLFGVWYGLDLDAHRSASKFSRPLGDVKRHGGNQPYLLLLPTVLMAAAAVARDKFPEFKRMELIIDEQNVFSQDMNALYPGMRETLGKVAGKELADIMPAQLMFRDDKEFLPLQAADMMAGTIRRVCLNDPAGLRAVDLSAVKCWPGSQVINDKAMVKFAQGFTRQPLVGVREPRPARKTTKKR